MAECEISFDRLPVRRTSPYLKRIGNVLPEDKTALFGRRVDGVGAAVGTWQICWVNSRDEYEFMYLRRTIFGSYLPDS